MGSIDAIKIGDMSVGGSYSYSQYGANSYTVSGTVVISCYSIQWGSGWGIWISCGGQSTYLSGIYMYRPKGSAYGNITVGSFSMSGISPGDVGLTLTMNANGYEYSEIPAHNKSNTTYFNLPTLTSGIGAPSNVRLTSYSAGSGAYVTPGASVSIAWNAAAGGTNNPVSSYTVTLAYGGTSVSSWNVGTATSTSFTASGSYRGSQIRIYITAHPSASGFSNTGSGWKDTGYYINRLPTISVSRTSADTMPSTGGTPTFSVSSGNGGDSQTISTQVSINGGGWQNYSGSLSRITSQTTYRFRANDGLETAESGTYTIKINAKPVISSMGAFTYTAYTPGATTSYPLAYKFSAQQPSIQSGKTITKYQAYIRHSDTSSGMSASTQVAYPEQSNLPTAKNVSDVLTTRGKYFQLGLRVKDSYEWSDIQWDTSKTFYTPLNINPITNLSESHMSTNNFICTDVSLSWSNPAVDAQRCALAKQKISITVGSKAEQALSDWSTTISTSATYDVSSLIGQSEEAYFIIYVEDVQGNQATSRIKVIRANNPYPSSSSYLGVNRATFNPKTERGSILQPVLSNTFSGDVSISTYQVQFYVNDTKYIDIYNGPLSGSTIQIPYTAVTNYANFCDKLWDNTYLNLNNNTIYTGTKFRIRAKDIYNQWSEWLYSSTLKDGDLQYYGDISLVFCISPTITTGSTTIQLGYNQAGVSDSLVTMTSGKTAISNEWIKVTTSASDVNTGDVLRYELQYATTTNFSNSAPTGWSAFKVIKPKQSSNILTYQLGNVDTDTYVKFRVVVYDSTYESYNTPPAVYDFGNAWIRVSAIKKPFVSLSSVNLNGTNTTLTVTWQPLGSGASSTPNTAGSGTWKTDRLADSSAYDGAQVCTLLLETTTDRADFDTETQVPAAHSNGSTTVTTTTETSANITLSSKTRTYVRAKLTFRTGKNGSSNSTTTYYSNILVLYVTEPAVAYRKTGLGIFTQTVGNDQVVNIQGNSSQRKVTTGTSYIDIDPNTNKGTLYNYIIGSTTDLSPALGEINIDGGTY